MTPDSLLVYLVFPLQYTIYVIDTLTNTVSATLGGIIHPNAVDFNPTGTRAYITSGKQPGSVKVLDTATYEVIKSYAVGDVPLDIMVDYKGKWVGVTNYGGSSISFIDTTTGTVRTQNVGPNPRGLAWVR